LSPETVTQVNNILVNLGEAYFLAYEVGQADIEMVHQSVKCFKAVLDYSVRENHGSTMYRMGKCYSALYMKKREISDLEAAIINLEAATQHQLDKEERQIAMVELSRMLARKYDRSRAPLDLDNAIRWARVAAQGNQENEVTMRNLANLLYQMYKATKDTRVLDELIDNYERIWTLYQRNPGKSAASFHYRFGTALIWRFDEASGHRRLQDVERAIHLLQLAVADASPQSLNDYQRRLEAAVSRQDKIQAKRLSSSIITLPSEDILIPSNCTEVLLLNTQVRAHRPENIFYSALTFISLYSQTHHLVHLAVIIHPVL
jgi:tetratricopeptide (TPR) repeat protein